MNVKQINACVIIPTYNNEKTLSKVISGVLQFCDAGDLFIVNDGSTDQTAAILEPYKSRSNILLNELNKGKGYSLRKAFKAAINKGYYYAITIDSDGQHYPDDIPVMIEASIANPGALLMGSRNMEQAGVPAKSSFGNKFSNFWFWVETGLTLPDTQTGFRLYPLEPLKKIKLFTVKFETEIEVIVKLAWHNVKVIPVPVKVLYDMHERVSHFRPFKDFTRISLLNTWLVVLTLIYYLPKRLLLKIYKKGLFTFLKEEALDPTEIPVTKAVSVGFGIFMGIFPVWGFQLLIGIPLAVLFRLNKVLFIAAANISLPPMIPVIIFLSYMLGGFFVEHKVKFDGIHAISLASIHVNIVQYLIGAVLLAFIAGLISFIIALSIFRKKKIIS